MKHIIVALLLLLNFAFAQNKAMIIFDASGSMWGQIDKIPKIDIAKDALKSVVKGWNENTELGVMAYGHRVKGDCNDIQTLVPIGKVDKGKIINAVMGISPKGKTPISRSLKKAANELKFTEDKATVILISDGKETCDPDPCGTAKELKKQGIDFVAHVIGFNVDKATDKELECIAKATGGEYFSAKNAKELNSAIKEVAKKVEKPTPPPPPKPKIKKLDHNVEVTASEKEGGKWINADCRIYNEDKSDDWYIGPRKKEPGVKTIPVGKYTVRCKHNHLTKEVPFEIKAGEVTKVHITFVSFLITTKCEGKVNYEIYAPNGQLVFDKSKVACNKPLKVTLNPGTYTISVIHNDTTKEQKFTIGGKESELIIDLTNNEPSKEELIKADSANANDTTKEVQDEISKTQQKPKITKDEAKELQDRLKKAKDIVNMAAILVGKDTKEQQKQTDKKFEELSKDIEMFTK